METNYRRLVDRRAVLGIILVLLGVFVLAENLDWIHFSIFDIVFSFPMILIVIGAITLNHRKNSVFSFVLIGLGAVMLIPRILNIPFDYHRMFLPAVFVALGLLILFRKKKGHDHNVFEQAATESTLDFIDEVNVFGGSERKITSKSFKGGKVTSIFGGSTFDMLDCELSEGKNVIDVVNIFGGTKMLIPADWNIHVEVVSIFGGFADKRKKYTDVSFASGKELYITGVVIFGGGEIKSF